MSRIKRGKVRLCIDFTSPEALLSFIHWLREAVPEYQAADAWLMDGLDKTSGTGITVSNTFVFRNSEHRQPGSRLRDMWDGLHVYQGPSELNCCTFCGHLQDAPMHRKEDEP